MIRSLRDVSVQNTTGTSDILLKETDKLFFLYNIPALTTWIEDTVNGGYKLLINESIHHKGSNCAVVEVLKEVATATYRSVIFVYDINDIGDVILYSNERFLGKIYILG